MKFPASRRGAWSRRVSRAVCFLVTTPRHTRAIVAPTGVCYPVCSSCTSTRATVRLYHVHKIGKKTTRCATRKKSRTHFFLFLLRFIFLLFPFSQFLESYTLIYFPCEFTYVLTRRYIYLRMQKVLILCRGRIKESFVENFFFKVILA